MKYKGVVIKKYDGVYIANVYCPEDGSLAEKLISTDLDIIERKIDQWVGGG